ncbi:MAG: DUF262 domain-containing protein [Agitococcus sp.]|nr:DUF262 domain-containing protein [Agitococcus sp.]MDO9179078.1 DUF262 domain-containing protein [Agitococcus sp.]
MKSSQENLSLKERIVNSYANYVNNRELYPPKAFPVPATRLLQVGDSIELGFLKDSVVVALHEAGEAVTIRYTAIEKGAKDQDRVGTWHWSQLRKKLEVQPSHLVQESVLKGLTFSSSEISALTRMMLLQGVCDKPDFQRDYVWTPTDKASYLESYFEGRELGRFIFIRYDFPNGEVVFDGKQRLSTLVDFMTSNLDYKGTYWHELSCRDRTYLEMRNVQFATLRSNNVSRIDLLKIFLAVNAGGVPQTPAHLQFVCKLLAQEQAKLAQQLDAKE